MVVSQSSMPNISRVMKNKVSFLGMFVPLVTYSNGGVALLLS